MRHEGNARSGKGAGAVQHAARQDSLAAQHRKRFVRVNACSDTDLVSVAKLPRLVELVKRCWCWVGGRRWRRAGRWPAILDTNVVVMIITMLFGVRNPLLRQAALSAPVDEAAAFCGQ